MKQDEILDKLTCVICGQLGVNPDEVTPEARFAEDFGADDVELVELFMALEEEFFGIEISDDAGGSLQTVGDVVRYYMKRLS